jgi:hypothetical protein
MKNLHVANVLMFQTFVKKKVPSDSSEKPGYVAHQGMELKCCVSRYTLSVF